MEETYLKNLFIMTVWLPRQDARCPVKTYIFTSVLTRINLICSRISQ